MRVIPFALFGAMASLAVCPALPTRVAHAAQSADIDLVANKGLVHVYRKGLFIPVASEALWKYEQQYSNPWGPVVKHDGASGRVLDSRSATLNVPWEGKGQAHLIVTAHGLTKGQKISVHVNGQNIKNTDLNDAWQSVAIDLGVKALRTGENEIRLTLGSKSRVDGKSAYALISALELVQGAVPADNANTNAENQIVKNVTLDGSSKAAFVGVSGLSFLTEIPANATLSFVTGLPAGNADISVSIQAHKEARKDILKAQAGPKWQGHKIDLSAYQGKLVRLWFEAKGSNAQKVAWAQPVITMPVPAPKTLRHFKNAVLIVVDAMRSDRLSLYAKTRVNTPNFTREANQNGVTFLNNQAASPSSPPSHGSIQTGMIPRVHGIAGDKSKITPGTPLISSQLTAAGFSTGYYGNNPFGMARLEEPGNWTAFHQPNQEGKGIDCTVLMDQMLGFATAEAKKGKRFFISSLPYEPHTPYRYHAGISDKYHKGSWDPPVGKFVNGDLLGALSAGKTKLNDQQWNQLKALYDGEVEHMDGCFATFMAGLRKNKLWQDTLVVVTADHGEGMFEHGFMGHAWGHHGELGNVPFILLGEGLVEKGMKVDVVSSHIDIVPTILDLLDVKAASQIQGQSLVPLVAHQGQGTPRVVSLEYGRSYSLRARPFRYIVDYQGIESLYDLQADPEEKRDLVKTDDLALRYMRDIAGPFLIHRSEWHTERWGDLNNRSPQFGKSNEGP